MKLTTVTNVSLDGVTQGHRRIDAETRREAGAPDEDGSGGFERFGWASPLLDEEASTFISRTFQRATRSCSAGARHAGGVAGVGDLDFHVVGEVAKLHGGRDRWACVFEGVGQRLLRDAVDGQGQAGAERYR